MDTTIFTNILFSALSIFLIFITIGLTFLIINIILVLKVIKKESEKIVEDINNARERVKDGGAMIASFVTHAVSFFNKFAKKSKK